MLSTLLTAKRDKPNKIVKKSELNNTQLNRNRYRMPNFNELVRIDELENINERKFYEGGVLKH